MPDNKMYAVFLKRKGRPVYYRSDVWTERKVYRTLGTAKGAIKTKEPFGSVLECKVYELDFDEMTIKEIEL